MCMQKSLVVRFYEFQKESPHNIMTAGMDPDHNYTGSQLYSRHHLEGQNQNFAFHNLKHPVSSEIFFSWHALVLDVTNTVNLNYFSYFYTVSFSLSLTVSLILLKSVNLFFQTS